MEKLQDTINKIIDNHDEWCTLEGKKIGLKKIIKAVKARDNFIIGKNEIDTSDIGIGYVISEPKERNKLRISQRERAEESR